MPNSLEVLLMDYDSIINMQQCMLCGKIFFQGFL